MKKTFFCILLGFSMINGLFAWGESVKKLFHGFSLSMKGSQGKPNLFVADLEKDGNDGKIIQIPSVHPLIKIIFKVDADYYTEKVNFKIQMNRISLVKGRVKGLFPEPRKLPLSLLGR